MVGKPLKKRNMLRRNPEIWIHRIPHFRKLILRGRVSRVRNIEVRLTKRIMVGIHDRTSAIASGRGSSLLSQFNHGNNHKFEG